MNNDAVHHTTKPVSRREQFKALGIASLGGMLEYFEFIIFVFLAPQISNHFSSPDMPEWLRLMQTFGIFAAGFLIRPIGGIMMAQLGDLVGRKRIFSLTLCLMAGPTLIIGLLPGYAQVGILAPILLLVCRLLQGISLGGELPGAISFVSEQVSARRITISLGILAASVCLGSLAGSTVVAYLTSALGAEAMMEYGWRIPFLIGGVFGLVSVYLRRFTHETPIFEAMKAKRMLSEKPPFTVLLAKHRFNLLAGMTLAASTCVISAATQQFPITFFVTMKHLPMEGVSSVQSLLIGATMVGNVVVPLAVTMRLLSALSGYIVCQALTIVCLLWAFAQTSVEGLLLPALCLGFVGGGSMALSLTLLARGFPAQLRFTGLATCYNIPIAIFGGTALLVLTYITHSTPGYVAFYPAFFCAISIVAAVLLWRNRQPISPFTNDESEVQAESPQSHHLAKTSH